MVVVGYPLLDDIWSWKLVSLMYWWWWFDWIGVGCFFKIESRSLKRCWMGVSGCCLFVFVSRRYGSWNSFGRVLLQFRIAYLPNCNRVLKNQLLL
jgi:hypothetical protein